MIAPILAEGLASAISMETVLSLFSVVMTGYFWMIRARQERPCLNIFQLQDFRANPRQGDPEKKTKRLALTPYELGGVLVANNSTRQTSILRFDCHLEHEGGWIKGVWGYLNDDKPPWNIPPESTIALSPACFFEVPEDFELPENARFYIAFVTVNGRRFGQHFTMKAPQL